MSVLYTALDFWEKRWKQETLTMTKLDTDIIFYAFRYALGRRTGAVDRVSKYILNNWEVIPEQDKVNMICEIKDAIEKDWAGAGCDIQEWQKIVERSEKEQL